MAGYGLGVLHKIRISTRGEGKGKESDIDSLLYQRDQDRHQNETQHEKAVETVRGQRSSSHSTQLLAPFITVQLSSLSLSIYTHSNQQESLPSPVLYIGTDPSKKKTPPKLVEISN